jgi:Activator of Hsp90 ATPase homolog 1-like protein
VVPATHYGMSADYPLEMLVTVIFEELGEKTKLTLRHVGIPTGADRDEANVSWSLFRQACRSTLNNSTAIDGLLQDI